MPPILIIGGIGFILVISIIVLVVMLTRGNRTDPTEQRLEELSTILDSEWTPGPSDSAQEEDGRSLREQLAAQLDNALADQGMAGNMRAALRKANLKLTVSEYLMLHVVMAAAGGLIGFILWRDLRAIIPILIGFFVPQFYVRIRQRQRLKSFNNQLADILGLWVNALRAGFSVPQAMEAVAKEAPAPAGEEFQRVVAEMAIGVPMDTALNNMLSRIDSEDLDLVFTAVNIQREVGGNLAEILDTISHTIRERVRIKGEVQVLTAQGRITGLVIGLMPVLLAIFLLLINPGYMAQLFQGSPVGATIPVIGIPCGWPLIGAGLTSMGIGLAIIRSIVSIEV